MKNYLKVHSGDFLLCIFISMGISVNVFAGYEMNDPWSGNLLVVGAVTALMMLFLFFTSYKRAGLIVSIAVTGISLIGAVIALGYTGAFESSNAIDKSPLLFWMIVIATSSIVFWATRSKISTIGLILGTTWMIAAFNLLQYPVSKWGYFLFLFCICILLMHQTYLVSFLKSGTSNGNTSAYFVQIVALSLGVFLLASSTYYFVIQPLSPPTDEMQLSKKLMSMELFEKYGISSKVIVPANQEKIDKQEIEKEKKEQKEKNKNKKRQMNQDKKENNLGKNHLFNVVAVTYQKAVHYGWILIVVILLLLVLTVPAKQFLRKKWYRKLVDKKMEDAAMDFYLYFTKRLDRAGLKRPENLTPLEFAKEIQEKVQGFSVYDANFLKLTEIYIRIIYGYQKISEQEYDLFQDFYKEFHRNLRREMGTLKYCLNFFRI